MNPSTKKKSAPQTRNQEQLATLEKRLGELGEQTITLLGLLELVSLTEAITMLKENPNSTIF